MCERRFENEIFFCGRLVWLVLLTLIKKIYIVFGSTHWIITINYFSIWRFAQFQRSPNHLKISHTRAYQTFHWFCSFVLGSNAHSRTHIVYRYAWERRPPPVIHERLGIHYVLCVCGCVFVICMQATAAGTNIILMECWLYLLIKYPFEWR